MITRTTKALASLSDEDKALSSQISVESTKAVAAKFEWEVDEDGAAAVIVINEHDPQRRYSLPDPTSLWHALRCGDIAYPCPTHEQASPPVDLSAIDERYLRRVLMLAEAYCTLALGGTTKSAVGKLRDLRRKLREEPQL